MSEQFVPNFDKQYTITEKWLPTSGMDIYIDGTRHLPDNSSMTKLTVRIVDSDLKAVLPPEVVLADMALSSTLCGGWRGVRARRASSPTPPALRRE